MVRAYENAKITILLVMDGKVMQLKIEGYNQMAGKKRILNRYLKILAQSNHRFHSHSVIRR